MSSPDQKRKLISLTDSLTFRRSTLMMRNIFQKTIMRMKDQTAQQKRTKVLFMGHSGDRKCFCGVQSVTLEVGTSFLEIIQVPVVCKRKARLNLASNLILFLEFDSG